MENEREVLLEVNHLNVTYGSGKKAYEAVQDANFKIYKGETFGLVGESGSGKTTIGRASCAFCPPPAVRSSIRARRSTAEFPASWTGRSSKRSR